MLEVGVDKGARNAGLDVPGISKGFPHLDPSD